MITLKQLTMKNLVVVGLLTISSINAESPFDDEKCFHIRSDDPETCSDPCDEPQPWYHGYHHHHHIYGENLDAEDPAAQLDEDASWAGEREEFSDMLFR